jgi:3-hydroxybutyryl-CoA dehydrogenase
MMNNNTIGVIGAGAMGSGIAQIAATSGNRVVVVDNNNTSIAAARESISKSLKKFESKNKLNGKSANDIISLISFSNEIDDCKNCNLIIEAVVENLEIKKQIFGSLENIVSNTCILASNTSSLSIASIAGSCNKPDRVIGIHFFNPAVLMPLVEIIPGISTHESTVTGVYSMLNSWGKVLVKAKDTPGFIVNRIARPFYGEAIRIYEEGIASVAQIDASMKMKGFRMGPFELMDYIGHDVNFKVTETVWKQMFYDPKYKPSFTQQRLYESGFLGRKSGKGFYEYENGKAIVGTVSTDEDLSNLVTNRIIALLINEAADALYLNIASRDDIDLAMTKGVNYPKGLLKWADEWGVSNVLKVLEKLYSDYNEDRYRPGIILKKMASESTTFY